MTSISSLTGGTSSTEFSGSISGLASGMDTDSIIEAMSYYTLQKIGNTEADICELEWQMEAYREVITALLDFKDGYVSLTSDSSLYSNNAFATDVLNALGDNAMFIELSGVMSNDSNITISGVEQLAEDAQVTSGGTVSNGSITTGTLNFETMDTFLLSNETMTFMYNGKDVTVTLGDGYVDENGDTKIPETAEELVTMLNQAFEKVELDDGRMLSDVLELSLEDGALSISHINNSASDISLLTISDQLKSTLNLSKVTQTFKADQTSDNNSFTSTSKVNEDEISGEIDTIDKIDGATINFIYNGDTYSFDIDYYSYDTPAQGYGDGIITNEELVAGLQNQINNTIGSGRISVELIEDGDDVRIQFTTTNTDGSTDPYSTLQITGSNSLFGSSGVFNMSSGASNAYDTSLPLSQMDYDRYDFLFGDLAYTLSSHVSSMRNGEITVNGFYVDLLDRDYETMTFADGTAITDEEIDKRLAELSLDDIMNSVNNSDANVYMSYSSYSDTFTMVSTLEGAGGEIDLDTTSNAFVLAFFGGTYTGISSTPSENMDTSEDIMSESTALKDVYNLLAGTTGTLTINTGSTYDYENMLELTACPSELFSISHDENWNITIVQNGESIYVDGGVSEEEWRGAYNSYYAAVAEYTATLTVDEVFTNVNNSLSSQGLDAKFELNTDESGVVSLSFVDSSGNDVSDAYFINTPSDNTNALNGCLSDPVFKTDSVTDKVTIDFFNGADVAVKEGQDAIIYVDYDGVGGADPVKISKSNNDFKFDDMTVTVTGTFNVDEDGELISTSSADTVKITGTQDIEDLSDRVQQMVDDYNALIELVYSYCSTKPDSDYYALTETQKSDMTADEIELWETEAKVGILFGDSTLISLSNDLRTMFFENGEFDFSWEDIGITVSSNWSDNGKLTFNSSKFAEAMAENPDEVARMFTTDEKDENGNTIGIMASFSSVIEKYAATTGSVKGSLIELAGHPSSPLSVLNNTLLSQIDYKNEILTSLKERLETEQARYQSRFTALEIYISTMNSQSSWLYSQMS